MALFESVIDPRPTTLFIGPFEWFIHWKDLGEKMAGQTTYEELRIEVSTSLPDELQKETLLHEILHAIHMVSGSYFMGKISEERAIRGESPLLFDALRRNPEVFEWIRS